MRTTARTPRAHSTFKTNESRETYRMREEIISILSMAKNGEMLSTDTIVTFGNWLGYCRPLKDDKRIAESHPYWKILSDMTDTHSRLFANNIEEYRENGHLCYRLRTDIYRKRSGLWVKRHGQKLLFPIPQNN